MKIFPSKGLFGGQFAADTMWFEAGIPFFTEMFMWIISNQPWCAQFVTTPESTWDEGMSKTLVEGVWHFKMHTACSDSCTAGFPNSFSGKLGDWFWSDVFCQSLCAWTFEHEILNSVTSACMPVLSTFVIFTSRCQPQACVRQQLARKKFQNGSIGQTTFSARTESKQPVWNFELHTLGKTRMSSLLSDGAVSEFFRKLPDSDSNYWGKKSKRRNVTWTVSRNEAALSSRSWYFHLLCLHANPIHRELSLGNFSVRVEFLVSLVLNPQLETPLGLTMTANSRLGYQHVTQLLPTTKSESEATKGKIHWTTGAVRPTVCCSIHDPICWKQVVRASLEETSERLDVEQICLFTKI